MRGLLVAACSLIVFLTFVQAQSPHQSTSRSTPRARAADAPTLNQVLARMSQYVAAYGARASMFVGTEDYRQRVEAQSGMISGLKPLRLLSEFAIVKAGSDNWVGYRDVVEVDAKPVTDRKDRLVGLLSGDTVEAAQLRRINDESARFNIGPISRNFNVPTTVLFFFLPGTIERFSFERKGTKEIGGVQTWELEFKETARPTLIRTRGNRDVPCKGRLWVVPADGAIVRTRIELRNFADDKTVAFPGDLGGPGSGRPMPDPGMPVVPMPGSPQRPIQTPPLSAPPPSAPPPSAPPPSTPPPSTPPPSTPPPSPPRTSPTPTGTSSTMGGGMPIQPAEMSRGGGTMTSNWSMPEIRRLESLAQIEVTYRLDRQVGAWLPLKMSELYEGAMQARGGRALFLGRAEGVAEYSNFRRFETSAKIVTPK